jgi:glyoxylate reductase
MSKPKVFVTRILPQSALDKIAEVADMEVWQDEVPPPREVILEKVKDIDGLLCLLTDKIDAEIMDAGRSLRVISNYAVGFDNINIPAATERGLPVGNTPGVLTETTADLAFTLLMASARRIVEADNYTRDGKWRSWGPMLFLGQDIHHATLGIVGLGRIGQEMAKRGKGFDMKLIYHDAVRNEKAEQELGIEYVEMDELLKQSDFVSLHVPLMESTRHLISDREFDMMKSSAVLINSARGPVVDQKALYEALKAGKIAHAGLDVFDVEPISGDDPLLTLDNVTAVPHIASASIATRTKMAMMAADNLIAGLNGERLPTQVNTEVKPKAVAGCA